MNAKDKRRDRDYRRKYGISLVEYNRMLAEQDKRCAICRNKPRTKRLVVDHNHYTKKIRGLLCSRCNRNGLGAFHDDYKIVQRAAAYMTRDKWSEMIAAATP